MAAHGIRYPLMASRPHPARLKLRIEFERGHLGPGKIELLENIVAKGSLAAAAREMGMSYKRAWELLAATNDIFDEPVAVSHPGRNIEGGTRLTPFGERVIRLYRAAQRKAAECTVAVLDELSKAGRPASTRRGVPRQKRR